MKHQVKSQKAEKNIEHRTIERQKSKIKSQNDQAIGFGLWEQ
ncbi:hypothetical protein [Herpetosiphon giganteus]|nr:hypothetical protein [Herpetosiphon giganteus]MBM7846240.1 hypothetical protein [Herpetosiphon giganteus]